MYDIKKVLAVVGVLVVMCVCAFLALPFGEFETAPGYREQDVVMVQPVGEPEIDTVYAGVNEQNANANQTNKEGEAELTVAQARATQIIEDAETRRIQACGEWGCREINRVYGFTGFVIAGVVFMVIACLYGLAKYLGLL